MISIERISMEFVMDDERFAQGLYADWDSFCHTCVGNILEECLSAYDRDRILHEIEKLDLDLGNISQEDFHSEFSRRLREELLKVLPYLQPAPADEKEATTAESRFANLLYYLEYGVQKTEWADIDFDLSEELGSVVRLDKRYLEKMAELCMANESVLRRILLQTDKDAPLVELYSVVMDRTFFVKDGKRRFMELFLEIRPDVPVRFVHETEEDGRLHCMAELLNTGSVRRVMEKETEEHAEVDIPSYWYYLYEWLILYYPYNGVAIFGSKSDFIEYMHYRLLTFIHKRNNTFYLSKTELTAAFLLEVFGAAYYKEVLNAIYNMQPRNADGSPAYDGYYNLQLYRVFMQLSLLYLPMKIEGNADDTVSKKRTSSLLTDFRMEDLNLFLKDTRRSVADKRMLINILLLQKPESFILWLKGEAINDATLITIMAGLMDERTLERLLASTSLLTMNTVDEVMRFLTPLVKENRLADGLSYERFTIAFCKAVLLWIKDNDYTLWEPESTKALLLLIHKEIIGTIGKSNEPTVEKWMEELYLLENEARNLQILDRQDDEELKECIQRLRALLTGENITEAIKRRLIVSFLERHKDSYEDAIRELNEQGLLEDVINLIRSSAMKFIIRQMITRYIRTEKAEKLLLLIERLFANEYMASAYLQDKSLTLKVQVFVWLAKELKAQSVMASPIYELSSLFLASLFGKENVVAVGRLVIAGMAVEIATTEMKDDDMLEVLELLPYTGSFSVHRALFIFEQWSQHLKVYSNTIQTLLESHWNTSGGFMKWLKETRVTAESKRELLQALVRAKPQELVELLRHLPKDKGTVSLMATYIPTEMLLDGMDKANAKQALLLSRTIDFLQKERGRFAFLSSMAISFTTALSEALLLFMQDNDTLGGKNLTEQEVVEKFLEHLYYVYTRRTDYNDNKEWKRLQNEVTNGLGLDETETKANSISENNLSERLLSEYGCLNDSELYNLAVGVLDKEPKLFVEILENRIDTEFIRRISHVTDKVMLGRIVTILSSVSGLENSVALIKLMEWLRSRSADRITTSNVMSALLSWISTADWKKQSSRQMAVFFLSHLYGNGDTNDLPLEMLTDESLPEEVRKWLFHSYINSHPAELLDYMERLVKHGKLPLDKWTEWVDLPEWLELTASVSLTLEELLRQVIEHLLVQGKLINNETVLRYGLIRFIATNGTAKFAYYVDKAEVVRSFVLSLPFLQEKTAGEKEETVCQVMEGLGLTPEEEKILEESLKDDWEVVLVGNAGLCLLSPWFPRLFGLLDYLDEEKRNFKDTASRIRAVFLLQYLANPQEKDYREPELAFNRLLVALPAQVPLPKRVELTDEERQTADNMLAGVKGNWRKMDGTSVSGFRQSFILRDGRLEQQDERWLLTIESRVYDILLDAVPWGFRQIRFPWLKKYIQVFWHEKQEF